MLAIKKYLRAVAFGLRYAFTFALWPSVFLTLIVAARAVLPYVGSYFLGKLVDAVVAAAKAPPSGAHIWYFLLMYVLASSIPGLVGNFQYYYRRVLYSILSIELDLAVLRKRETIDIATYEDPKFQDLNQRAFRNGMGPIYNVAGGQLDTLYAVASLVVGTAIAIHFNVLIYLVIVLTAVPSFFVDMKFASRNWSIWAKDSPEQRRYADLRQHIVAKTSLIETKLLQAGGKIFAWIKDILTNFYKKQMGNERSRLWQTSMTDAVSAVGLMFGLFLLVKQVIAGTLAVGSLVYFISTFFNIRNSISSLLTTVSNQYEDSLIANDIIDVMETKPFIKEPENPASLGLSKAPTIVFENVSFKYHSSDKWSLRKVNLTFAAGDNIGLVGNNGAGKTTLVKLLCRIYDPTEGRILIDGVDLKEIATQEWWSYLAVMFQDYASYDFIVQDAIAIGRPDKSTNLTKVVEAAHTSQAHTFIEEWKDTYNQQLGVEFKGKEPSKGQRQKLSIAKTLYRDGFVMILDEPTASVDAESESKIFDSIENLPKDRTAILISHDFSTISACDKIFVLEEGKLIEEGDHEELMGKKGKYAELYELQAARFKK
jgi:ATP-binding cassette subfamily B protein